MHTFRNTITTLIVLCLILVLAAPAAATVTARQDTEPVTLYRPSDEVLTRDPQLSSDDVSAQVIENTFISLTDMEPDTDTLIPELATSWQASEGGLVWTFTLRDDVPWVRWDAGEAAILRMVTAHDVVYGIQRACDPRLNASYRGMVAGMIAGCASLAQQAPETVSDADYALVQVQALDDTTLHITLTYPAVFFLSMTTMSVFSPVPRDIVGQYGDEWTDAEYIVTSGAFVVDEWIDRNHFTLLANPHYPAELRGPGNVERVVSVIVGDGEDEFALYEQHQIDTALLPWTHADVIFDPAYAGELQRHYGLATSYFAFAYDKPPFDNVHVRRAFATMMDIEPLLLALWGAPVAVPISHFAPPGLIGAVPLDEVGVGFDREYARAQLALGGYPNCEGFPPITVVGLSWWPDIPAFFASSAEDVLGCAPGIISWEAVEFDDLLLMTRPDGPTSTRPHVWALTWGADYPDAHNFLNDMLGCEGMNTMLRPCSEIDDLLLQASTETDILTRAALYRDIEERFFGPDGEFPIAPGATFVTYTLQQPWVLAADNPAFGAARFDWFAIDQEMQLAARGE